MTDWAVLFMIALTNIMLFILNRNISALASNLEYDFSLVRSTINKEKENDIKVPISESYQNIYPESVYPRITP